MQGEIKHAHLAWTFLKAFTWGTGTKTTIAFFPPFTSTSLAAEICRGRSSALSSGTLFSKSTRAWATLVSTSSGGVKGALAVRRILLLMDMLEVPALQDRGVSTSATHAIHPAQRQPFRHFFHFSESLNDSHPLDWHASGCIEIRRSITHLLCPQMRFLLQRLSVLEGSNPARLRLVADSRPHQVPRNN